jgi:hypothetical protein
VSDHRSATRTMTRMPTRIGDVVILFQQTRPTRVVCVVTTDGQQ